MRYRRIMAALAAAVLIVPVAAAKAFKWVDEKGVTHYGDRVPPQYANQIPGKAAPRVERAPTADELRAREEAARRETERQRQDHALLATYANEKEIEEARARDLKRVQGWLASSSAGLAQAKGPEERRKLEAVVAQGQRETDAINARYDGFRARFAELKAAAKASSSEASAAPASTPAAANTNPRAPRI